MGSMIRDLRQGADLTQAELAADLGVNQQVVARWETGASSPKLHHLTALAARFRVTTDQLLGMDEAAPPPRTEAALAADPAISDDSRRALLAAYRAARSLPGAGG